MRVLLDTSCLVAAVLPQHEHHAATVVELGRRRAAGDIVMVAAHAVTEAYAVLTRLPPPHRLAAADALAVIDRNWGKAETIALTAAEAWRVLREQAAAGLGGGRISDAQIAQCARKAKAAEIVTWNVRHFEGSSGVRAVAPEGQGQGPAGL
jgi:predicted nucleic acid-binding protein